MIVGIKSLLAITFLIGLVSILFFKFNFTESGNVYNYFYIIIPGLIFYLFLIFGFNQIFIFRKNEVRIYFLHPFKKKIILKYQSLAQVHIYRYSNKGGFNLLTFQTKSGEIKIHNIFMKYEIKKMNNYLKDLGVTSEIHLY